MKKIFAFVIVAAVFLFQSSYAKEDRKPNSEILAKKIEFKCKGDDKKSLSIVFRDDTSFQNIWLDGSHHDCKSVPNSPALICGTGDKPTENPPFDIYFELKIEMDIPSFSYAEVQSLKSFNLVRTAARYASTSYKGYSLRPKIFSEKFSCQNSKN